LFNFYACFSSGFEAIFSSAALASSTLFAGMEFAMRFFEVGNCEAQIPLGHGEAAATRQLSPYAAT